MKRTLMALVVASSLAWAQDKGPDPSTLNVELTVYLLSGTLQGASADEVPQDLTSTVNQLHSLFTYKSYKLTESFILRGRNSVSSRSSNFARTEGVLPGSGLSYSFSYNRVRISPEKPRMVHIDNLSIRLTKPALGRLSDGKRLPDDTVASISTDLDLGDGQKTVVGKSSINSAGDALILVIVPKVIE